MSPADPKPPPQPGWNDSQRRALIALLSIFLVVLCVRYAMNRAYVPDPQPSHGARYDELASRVDPNTADWQTLAAIPTLGEKRAKAIVAFRERSRAANPGRIVFQNANDLMQVKGIGRATMENLRPYLTFPVPTTLAAP